MNAPDLGRIEKAKEERRIQLINWDEYDRNYQVNYSQRSKASKRVVFSAELVFLEAAARGDINEVKKLLQRGINPNVTNEDGLTALHQCCIDNSIEMCTLLLENRANVNATDKESWTPLHASATCGHKELCGLLIDWGADLLAINVDGNMPYDLCDDDDTLILVESEMAKRHVTQEQIDSIRLRPEKNMLDDLQRRQSSGDDLSALDEQGAAPLHIACACGYVEVARYLLQCGINPQHPDHDGWFPIHIAVCWGQVEIIELLVSFGADMDAPTRSGQTVYTICDSKDLRLRLKEIWDRREELRKASKVSSLGFQKDRGSLRRRSNTSILRTSMRDKRRMTRQEAEREKQLGEQAEAKIAIEESQNGVDRIARPPPNIRVPVESPPLIGSPTTNHPTIVRPGAPIPPAGSVVAPPTRQRQPPTMQQYVTSTTPPVVDYRSPPNVNGTRSPHRGGKAPPSVPPRASKNSRSNGYPQDESNIHVAPPSNSDVSISSPTASSEGSPSESPDAAGASYVRPMQRNANGQMVPVKVTSPMILPNGGKPLPPSRDNRARTPKSSNASGTTTPLVADPYSTVIRDGPHPLYLDGDTGRLSDNQFHKKTDAAFVSTDTINSNGIRRKPFSCCHTM